MPTKQKKARGGLVLAGGAAIQLLAGIPAGWGAFGPGVEEEFGFSTGQTVLIFSFIITAFGIGCVAGGVLQDKAGARLCCLLGAAGLGGGFFAASFFPEGRPLWFYLGFSLPVGAGCALLTPSVMSCVQKWYPHKRGFATGVIGGAAGLSGAVLTFAARWLGGGWGMRVCFRVLGLVMAAVCALGALALRQPQSSDALSGRNTASGGAVGRNSPPVGSTAADKTISENPPASKASPKNAPSRGLSPKEVLRTRDYRLLVCAVAAAAPTVLLFSPVILPLAQQRGLSENAAAMIIAFGSLASAAGRLSMPWLSDRIGRRSTDLLLFAALAVFSVIFAFVQNWWVTVLYACLTFCYSGQAALLPAFATDRFGTRWAGVNYGLLTLGMSAGSLVFPLLARLLQGESAPHWIAAGAAAAGFVCLWFYGREPRAR